MAYIKANETITYKTAGSLDISFDLYLPKAAKNVPVLLYFHGGGCLQGHREQLAPWLRKGVANYNYACVAADYRLCPQVGIAEVFEDVRDVITFIRTKLPLHVGAGVLDVERLAVTGRSAGGYLTLLAGLYIEPKPKVILPIVPITDPLGWFFITPQPPPMNLYVAPEEELRQWLDPKAPVQANCNLDPSKDKRMHMAAYMTVSANLAKLWHVPENASAETDRWRLSRQVYAHRAPPTYVLHGDADTAVGVEQADEVVGALLGCGIEVHYERVHGEEHFLDSGPDYDNDAFFRFMFKHI